MSVVRTPEDEIDKPGYFYPPFTENWWYEGITYGGHTDYSVDWNRRTKTGGWIQDAGDPVFAQADGTVAEIEAEGGAVFINHYGGLWRTESRHMTDIKVKVGDKVDRGDMIGRIGKVGLVPSPGFTPSEHLHCVHWKRDTLGQPFQRTKQTFNGVRIRTSVYNSDSRPDGWNPPEAVMVQGPPPKATWESSFREMEKKYVKNEATIKRLKEQIASTPAGDPELLAQLAAAKDELEDAKVDLQNALDLKAALEAKWQGVGVAIDNLVDVYGE